MFSPPAGPLEEAQNQGGEELSREASQKRGGGVTDWTALDTRAKVIPRPTWFTGFMLSSASLPHTPTPGSLRSSQQCRHDYEIVITSVFKKPGTGVDLQGRRLG